MYNACILKEEWGWNWIQNSFLDWYIELTHFEYKLNYVECDGEVMVIGPYVSRLPCLQPWHLQLLCYHQTHAPNLGYRWTLKMHVKFILCFFPIFYLVQYDFCHPCVSLPKYYVVHKLIDTKRHPFGRHHIIYQNGRPLTYQHHQSHIWCYPTCLSSFKRTMELFPTHAKRNQITFTFRVFCNYEYESHLTQPLTPSQCKFIVACCTFNHRLAIDYPNS